MAKDYTSQLRSLVEGLQATSDPADRQKLLSALLAEADVLDKEIIDLGVNNFAKGFVSGYKEGYECGYEEGYDQGYCAGYGDYNDDHYGFSLGQ